MEKFRKMNLIFEFSISKLSYETISYKSEKKNLDPFFKTFFTNRGKNENINEKNWENEFDL